jgi:hypothetical protein
LDYSSDSRIVRVYQGEEVRKFQIFEFLEPTRFSFSPLLIEGRLEFEEFDRICRGEEIMSKTELEKTIPARDGTRCNGCGQCYEIMLMVPSEAKGGNRRRFARHYRCDSCSKVFSKYDFSFLAQSIVIYLFGGFVRSLIAAMRPSGGHARRGILANRNSGEPAAELLVPATKWVKKSQFRSRRIAGQRPKQRWEAVVNRDFIKMESLMPMHVV